MKNVISNSNSKYYKRLIKNNEDTFRLMLEIFNV